MKKILTLALLSLTIANADCKWYVNEFNHSKIRFETMQEVNAPYKITNDEKKRIIYLLENAIALCPNKEYYKTILKVYEN